LEARFDACCSVIPLEKGAWASRRSWQNERIPYSQALAMIRFLSVSLGFAAPAAAKLLVACLSWNDGRKERRRTLALRQWLREQ